METAIGLLHRPVAFALVVLVCLPLGSARAMAQQAPASTSKAEQPSASSLIAALPDAPAPAEGPAGQQQGSGGQATSPGQQSPSQPMGTAAAPAEPSGGVAASRPAGAVIAPAKQKRTRSFVIKLSLLIGGAVAIGTVAALSSASPSHP